MHTRQIVTRVFIRLGIAAITAASVVACSSGGGGGGSSSSGSKTLTIGIWSDLSKPYQNGSAALTYDAFYDPLVHKTAGTYDVTPALATSWSYNSTRTVLTFNIRQGVTFSDGTPVNAQAIKENIDWGRNPKSGSLVAPWMSPITSVVVKSPYVVQVNLSEPDALLLPLGLSQPIVSPAAFNRSNLAQDPDGSGPYVLDKSGTTPGVQYTAVRRKGYWDASAYSYDTIVYKVISAPTAMVNALRSGQINVAWIYQDAAAVGSLQKAGYNVTEYESGWNGLMLGDIAGKQIPALANLKVRQAINMALDRPAIVKAVEDGQAVASDQTFAPSSPAYQASGSQMYPYDVTEAKKLMAEAGYANGFSVTIPFFGSGYQYAPVIVQELGAIGIKVTAKDDTTTELNQYISDMNTHPYPIVFFEDDPYLHFITDALVPDGFLNGWHRTSPALTSALHQIDVANSTAALNSAYSQLGSFVLDNAWFAVIDGAPTIFASAPGIQLPPKLGDDAGPELSLIQPAK
jgi:peptide/nickel transport system substrate-binding protein